MDFQIPSNAYSVTLFIRRSKTPKEIPAERRTLTQAGIDLCISARPFWEDVVISLSTRFGVPVYYAGPLPAMMLSCYYIFTPMMISTHPHLASTASVKNIQDGRWFEAQKAAGLSRIEIIKALWLDSTLWEGQPFEHQSRMVHQFLAENRGGSFRVAVCDEPAITLALINAIEDEHLGLGPCEGILVFKTRANEIIGGQKLVLPI